MDKLLEWINRRFAQPLSPLFFFLGALLILLGVSTGLSIPNMSPLVIEPAFRWIALSIGCIFVVMSIFLYDRDPKDHNQPSFNEKVKQLKGKLSENGFTPDLIIGIARMGLPVAALLSKEFKESIIPVISIWPDDQFNNDLNNIKTNLNAGNIKRILIVDDICRSGRTLNDAKVYVEKSIGKMNSEIKTAAISFYKDDYRKIAPNFYVDRPESDIRDNYGDIDPR